MKENMLGIYKSDKSQCNNKNNIVEVLTQVVNEVKIRIDSLSRANSP